MNDAALDRPMGPWGIVTPGFWHVTPDQAPSEGGEMTAARQPESPLPLPTPAEPETGHYVPPGPPPEYAPRIAAVFAALERPTDAAELAAAGVEAEKLDREITARFGEAHSHTVNVREIRGWLALETQQPETATRWYLHTTGLQCRVWGAGHGFTRGSAQRAVAAWSTIADSGRARALGDAVLTMLQQTVGEQDRMTVHVRRRLATMQPDAAAQRPGPDADRPAAGDS
jgi:hypothetical protein